MTHVLIVEDEPKIADLLRKYLENAGYAVDWLDHGDLVMPWLANHTTDLLLLDWMLPGTDGIELCKHIRHDLRVPIVMVTAKVEEIDRLLGLELGADDYICKPFSPREVVARVKGILRRTQVQASSLGDALVLDTQRMTASFKTQETTLTLIEFKLLSLLMSQPSHIFSRDQLMKQIYEDHRVVSERTIDSHIKKLRQKIDDISAGFAFIHAVYGVGYKYERP